MTIERSNDLFGNADDVKADLRILEGLRWSRREFEVMLIEQSITNDEEIITSLRQESVYNLAEFFYMLKARDISDSSRMTLLATLHNDYIAELSEDPDKLQRLGLRKDRVLDAIFTADTLPRLIETWGDGRCLIDQSNLARFLVTLMSAETCRKSVVAAEAAGYLRRVRTPYGTTVVGSTGRIENIFAASLRGLRHRLTSGS